MKLLCAVLSVFALVTICEAVVPTTCIHGEYIQDKDDCHHFYQCVWSNPVKMPCPTNLVFSKEKSVCVGEGTEYDDCTGTGSSDPDGNQCDFNKAINQKLAEIKEQLLEARDCACSNCRPGLSCPGGWSQLNDTCYIHELDKVTWDEAISRCNALGGALAEADNELKDQFLVDLLPESDGTDEPGPWLNAKRFGNQWKWTTSGEPLTYTNWRPGEPNNVNSNEHCLHDFRFRDLRWNDRPCGKPTSYFCQKPAE